ncbi:hypothetical protein Brsp06_03505 [Brucella sp. NBRC 13694]|uniref:hypothetical protein n=1 Tax=Brucella sp. NBRC 13694 TaxID=3075482 RepID=UPI0030AC7793
MAVKRIDTAVEFDEEYPRVREWILNALPYSEQPYTEDNILIGLLERDYLLWTAPDAVCITSLTEWRNSKVCVFFLVGGTKGKAMRDIFVDGLPLVEQYARERACKYVLGIGRIGWKSILTKNGFTTEGNEYYKEV